MNDDAPSEPPTADAPEPPGGARRRQAACAGHGHGPGQDHGIDIGIADEPEPLPRDTELWRLARRTQGAALRLVVEWRTPLVRQVFRRDFVHVSRQLHALEASRRVPGLERACLAIAHATVAQQADEASARFAYIADGLQAAIATKAPADARLAYPAPAPSRRRSPAPAPTATSRCWRRRTTRSFASTWPGYWA